MTDARLINWVISGGGAGACDVPHTLSKQKIQYFLGQYFFQIDLLQLKVPSPCLVIPPTLAGVLPSEF